MGELFQLLEARQLAQNSSTTLENKAAIDALIAKALAELAGVKAPLIAIKGGKDAS